ncbi:MAG: methyl-accepting chemotaxis protein [Clostridia bacterium]|nr:methyl-accepting chemotaxis protein [Clostridia bacterium]
MNFKNNRSKSSGSWSFWQYFGTKMPQTFNFLNNISIKRRLLIFSLIISLCPITIIGIMSYTSSRNAISKKVSQYSIEKLQFNAASIGTSLTALENISYEFVVDKKLNQLLENYALVNDEKSIEDQNQLFMQYLSKYVMANQDIETIIFMDFSNKSKKVLTAGAKIDESFQGTFQGSPMYSDIVTADGKVKWSKTLNIYGVNYVTVGRLVKTPEASKPLGVFLILVKEQGLSNVVNNSEDKKKINQSIIIDKTGFIVASKNKAQITKNITGLLKKSKLLEPLFKGVTSTGSFFDEIEKEEMLVTYQAIGNRGWYILSYTPSSLLYKESNQVGVLTLIIGLISSIIAIIIAFAVSSSVSKPLNKVVECMKQAAQGDLTFRVDVKGKNELSNLASNYNHMASQIMQLIKDTIHTFEVFSSNIEELRKSSQQSSTVAESVALAIGEVSKGAVEQSGEAQKSTIQMSSLTEQIENLVKKAHDVEEITYETITLSQNSKNSLNLLIEKDKQKNEITENIIQNLNEFNESANLIRNVTTLIYSISQQTNLLALNAAIEAARAGEAGKGFAVVASEVEKLAKEAGEAAKDINDILKTIESKSKSSGKNIQLAYEISEEQREAVNGVQESFVEILNSMDKVKHKTEEINQFVQNVNTSKNITLESITNISSVSEETAASSEEVAASSQEQYSIAEHVKNLVFELNELVEVMVKNISRFKVED